MGLLPAALGPHGFTRSFSTLHSDRAEGSHKHGLIIFVTPVMRVNEENSLLSLPVESTSGTCTLIQQFGVGFGVCTGQEHLLLGGSYKALQHRPDARVVPGHRTLTIG